jgi:hypothetical protein
VVVTGASVDIGVVAVIGSVTEDEGEVPVSEQAATSTTTITAIIEKVLTTVLRFSSSTLWATNGRGDGPCL